MSQTIFFTNHQGAIKFAFNNAIGFESLKTFRKEAIEAKLNVVELHFENESVHYTDDTAKFKIAEYLWDTFKNITLDEDGVDGSILEPFLHFTPHTDVYDIWHWFEAEFELSVAKDLMKV
ncbi:MAG: hypothetical protein HRU38_06935 [Saccharospirillaceae bacterium]|nr:hypothetical protein [Saccharospirillaceae bacterium]